MKNSEYKIYGSEDNFLASIWWDGKEVKCSDPALEGMFKVDYDLDVKGGPEEIAHLASQFKGGYFRFRKA